ncbi:tyrosine-type recombinase/integrase [Scytonema millei]|uniref:Tyrosine-type recombinase/integrase n=1 Tax=Scytonema millei VB511283 TaxID=1245923 RepID=A0A9X5I3G3_9CYAN|nr:tyrosine-type recombinase/integrase [Scytonema millei]NHC33781.1 tyrosine-type recombinase/integrase [Scytonema millei VB511283]
MEIIRNSIRLRFRVDGKQKAYHLGLHDNDEGRKKAKLIAKQVELDLLADNFDQTFERYRVYPVNRELPNNRAVSQLFADFTAWKEEYVYKRTIEKYKTLPKYLESSGIGNIAAKRINAQDVSRFVNYLRGKLEPKTLKERLQLLSACWDWAKLENNHWKTAVKAIKVPPKQPPRPFTKQEIQAILGTFSELFPGYLPYVQFLFSTGVRTSEAIGLQWKHVADDCSTIWVGESLVKGVRKATKTNKARTIPLNPKVKQMLVELGRGDAEDLVFTTPAGYPIDDDNFARRYWHSALKRAGVDYRRPYNTRHTFVSHALQSGLSPVQVASLTGHSVEILFTHYAGVIEKPKLPDLF